VGPLVALAERGVIDIDNNQVVLTIYAPIIVLQDRSPAFAKVLESYASLWSKD
jgi:hypothetical protein